MSEEGKIFALKRIKLKKADRVTLQSYQNEIDILRSLAGKENIIQMVDSCMDLEHKTIYVRALCPSACLRLFWI
jgi:serine/threonine-protein kinase TTK/MPS1